MKYKDEFEKAYGKGSANQFGAHAFDVVIVLNKAIPMALAKAKPGTPQFRAALKEAFETMGRTPVSQGVLNWTATDHFGYTPETGVLLKVVNGDWQVVQLMPRRSPGRCAGRGRSRPGRPAWSTGARPILPSRQPWTPRSPAS